MNISKLLKALLLVAVLMVSVNAQEDDKSASCDDKYDVCVEKCEQKEDGSEKCIKTCDTKYEKCLESEPKPKED